VIYRASFGVKLDELGQHFGRKLREELFGGEVG